jgi:hypothetical protein
MQIIDVSQDPSWIASLVRLANRGFRRCNFSFRVDGERAVLMMRELAALEASVVLEPGVVEVEIEEALVLAAVSTCLHHGGEYLGGLRRAGPS